MLDFLYIGYVNEYLQSNERLAIIDCIHLIFDILKYLKVKNV